MRVSIKGAIPIVPAATQNVVVTHETPVNELRPVLGGNGAVAVVHLDPESVAMTA